jgi:hypothetical protein
MSMRKYVLGYKGINSYNEMDGRRRKTEKRQQLDRAEAHGGWLDGGPEAEGKGRLECRAGAVDERGWGWGRGQVPAQRQLTGF